jgi:hypothetical protein
MDAHLAALATQRDQVLASLSRLHQSLASTIVEVPAAGGDGAVLAPAADLDPDATAAHDVAGGGTPDAQSGARGAGADPGLVWEPGPASPGPGKADPDRDVGYPDEPSEPRPTARTSDSRGPGRFRDFINAAVARDNAGAPKDRQVPVLFDREAADDDQPPPPPSPSAFRRAGSQPDGSQRAGR